MQKLCLTLALLSISVSSAWAQNGKTSTSALPSDSITPTPVVIHQDERIAVLLDKKIYIPSLQEKVVSAGKDDKRVKIDKYGRVNIPGFRLQLMNSTDRAAVYGMKGKLYQIYPNVKQYVVAQAPFYKLRFGNFKTKEEAERYKKALSSMFPSGIYIVNDVIEAQIDPKSKAGASEEEPKEKGKGGNIKASGATKKTSAATATKPSTTAKPKAKTNIAAKPATPKASSAKPKTSTAVTTKQNTKNIKPVNPTSKPKKN